MHVKGRQVVPAEAILDQSTGSHMREPSQDQENHRQSEPS